MSTTEIKVGLYQLIEQINDNKILKAVYAALSSAKTSKKDFWGELSKQEKSSIERGLADVAAGRVKSHKEVMKKYQKWL